MFKDNKEVAELKDYNANVHIISHIFFFPSLKFKKLYYLQQFYNFFCFLTCVDNNSQYIRFKRIRITILIAVI